MNDNEIEKALGEIKVARDRWSTARAKFESDVQYMMSRLINEAIARFMSAEDIARYSGFTVKHVRLLMRTQSLDPKGGRRALAKTAAAALRTNAMIMGIEPGDMDLTSPLAYLPMGKKMREEFLETEAVCTGVHELPDEMVSIPRRLLESHIESCCSATGDGCCLDAFAPSDYAKEMLPRTYGDKA